MVNTKVPAKAPTGLTTEEMKLAVLDHFEQFVNQKRSEVALTNFSSDFLDHDEQGGEAIGAEAAISMMEKAYEKWPDLRVYVEDILAEDDKVMVRNIWRASDAKTGEKIFFKGFVLWRFAKGKIVERWATLTPPQTENQLGE